MTTNNAGNNKTGASGTVLQGQGVGTAADFSTATYPSTATGTGTILRANGTNWVATTATYPTTTTTKQLLYSSAANVVGEVTSGIDGVLISSHSDGTPSWLANSGTPGFVLTAQSGAPPAWAASSGGSGFTSIVTQVFTATGTYTPTAGMKYCIVEVIGGGGGGGGAVSGSTGTVGVAGGGAAGGYARKTISAATVGASKAVTIGAGGAGGGAGAGVAGGTSSFGAIISVPGGSPGDFATAGTVSAAPSNIGTIPTGGDINCIGGASTAGSGFIIGTDALVVSCGGGSSIYGCGGPAGAGTGSLVYLGNNGTNYGAGGGGSAILDAINVASGGNGADGVVIVTEYI